MIGVHSDAMKAVAGHHAFGAQRVRGWLVESVDDVPSIIALVYQDNGDVCAEVVWMDHTHTADLDLIVAYLNERAGGGEHLVGALRNIYCGARPIDAGAKRGFNGSTKH
ncbi:TPA: hypothetical protein L3932_004417 [Pseudomonas aeruginosa]|nr:hypothetical protein [Pseudomonas aeruginosa]